MRPKKFLRSGANHYDYLLKHLPTFFQSAGIDWEANTGIIACHGDKAYSYRDLWHRRDIPFNHGVSLYLLSYCAPYSSQSRETRHGWVPVEHWVVDVYPVFRGLLTQTEETIRRTS